mmetsp:Transcript_7080/g.16188  ORF Transcript_7080/g.16188 Transcript_7080/m.16188 type:complete len:112 (+) Transcript_7080:530-865(+)
MHRDENPPDELAEILHVEILMNNGRQSSSEFSVCNEWAHAQEYAGEDQVVVAVVSVRGNHRKDEKNGRDSARHEEYWKKLQTLLVGICPSQNKEDNCQEDGCKTNEMEHHH